ncbi:MAG: hypothetical protein JWM09_368 [Francisellaceae bacterium]|nr:hypothetical protein [Francisellaceae bacterium]
MILKKILKLSSILLIALMISGCGKKYANPTVKQDEFLQGQKAIVITKMIHPYKALFFNTTMPVDYSLSKVDENYSDKIKRHEYRGNLNTFLLKDTYDILMIDPGIYALESMSYSIDNYNYITSYFTTADGYNPDTENFVYGGFSINPGEIIYLGDFDINLNANNFGIWIQDNYDKAKAYFDKRYPLISNTIIKKALLRRGPFKEILPLSKPKD